MMPWGGQEGAGDKGSGCKGVGGKGSKNTGKKRTLEDIQHQPKLGRFTGTIKSFSPTSGFGFIISPDLQAQGHTCDVYLHRAERGAGGRGQQGNRLVSAPGGSRPAVTATS